MPEAVLDADAWDARVLALPAPHLLQSWAWGDFKARWGWSVERLAWLDNGVTAGDGVTADGRPAVNDGATAAGGATLSDEATADGGPAAVDRPAVAAVAQVLTRRVGRAPFRVGYIPKGPLLARPDDPAAWRRVLADLEAWARARRLVLLKIDADVPADADAVAAVWRSRGWMPSAEQIQFPNTMLSDLTTGEEALWAGMKPDTRRKIRFAERHAVTVRHGGKADLDLFYDLYAATGARQGFGIRSRDYYLDAWSMFLDRGWSTVILAEREGRALAGVIPVAFGPTAWYLYGASADAGREHRPAYLAQWESLRWAVGRGCTRYDWWGGPTVLDEGDPLWGVYRFKSGFGATLAAQQGAWDFPCGGWRYAAYCRADQVRRAWIAARAR